MISSFRCRETAKIWGGRVSRAFPPDIQRRVLRKLEMIHAATDPDDLRSPPGNRLEKLQGDRAVQWSLRVNDQYRICYTWVDGQAHDVELVDYH
jgi:toxin HigB-1